MPSCSSARPPVNVARRPVPKRHARPSSSSKRKPRGRKKSAKRSLGRNTFALIPAVLSAKHPDPVKQKALDNYLEHGTVALACAAAAIGRTTWYDWRLQDPTFNELVNEAAAAIVDQLEARARERALDADEPSDTLLIFLLKKLRPEVYADRQVITEISAEVRLRVEATQKLIASRPEWESEELLTALSEIWK
jgi:hypothetical protein